jgi:hypothetical protein
MYIIYIYIYIYACIYIHTYIHTYIHIHIYTHQVPAESDPLFAIRLVSRQLRALGYTALTDVFASFETTHLGAASIGQCHRATLKGKNKNLKSTLYSAFAQ